jgi:N12 class adenine-specific DNA methylase
MLTEYMVILEVEKRLMVLRPYQIYAVQQIIQRVQHSEQNGYIWHTTGSGKTLTSFKASQLIMRLPEVEKVLFVVDRSDSTPKRCVSSMPSKKIVSIPPRIQAPWSLNWVKSMTN